MLYEVLDLKLKEKTPYSTQNQSIYTLRHASLSNRSNNIPTRSQTSHSYLHKSNFHHPYYEKCIPSSTYLSTTAYKDYHVLYQDIGLVLQ